MDDNNREESAICLGLGQHREWQGAQRRKETGETREEGVRDVREGGTNAGKEEMWGLQGGKTRKAGRKKIRVLESKRWTEERERKRTDFYMGFPHFYPYFFPFFPHIHYSFLPPSSSAATKYQTGII